MVALSLYWKLIRPYHSLSMQPQAGNADLQCVYPKTRTWSSFILLSMNNKIGPRKKHIWNISTCVLSHFCAFYKEWSFPLGSIVDTVIHLLLRTTRNSFMSSYDFNVVTSHVWQLLKFPFKFLILPILSLWRIKLTSKQKAWTWCHKQNFGIE